MRVLLYCSTHFRKWNLISFRRRTTGMIQCDGAFGGVRRIAVASIVRNPPWSIVVPFSLPFLPTRILTSQTPFAPPFSSFSSDRRQTGPREREKIPYPKQGGEGRFRQGRGGRVEPFRFLSSKSVPYEDGATEREKSAYPHTCCYKHSMYWEQTCT